jgi:hypothetical protein
MTFHVLMVEEEKSAGACDVTDRSEVSSLDS